MLLSVYSWADQHKLENENLEHIKIIELLYNQIIFWICTYMHTYMYVPTWV